MAKPDTKGVITRTQVESRVGAALIVEKVTLSNAAKGLLRADSSGIRNSSIKNDVENKCPPSTPKSQ